MNSTVENETLEEIISDPIASPTNYPMDIAFFSIKGSTQSNVGRKVTQILINSQCFPPGIIEYFEVRPIDLSASESFCSCGPNAYFDYQEVDAKSYHVSIWFKKENLETLISALRMHVKPMMFPVYASDMAIQIRRSLVKVIPNSNTVSDSEKKSQ